MTDFAHGFDLEQLLGALYGEGGGGDAPESYGLFAHWVNTHVKAPSAADKPFLIVFGDVTMHSAVPQAADRRPAGGPGVARDVDAVDAWSEVCERWNVWFLRRPTGRKGDEVDRQWGKAIGEQKIIHIQDEQRAVDYAMGLIARAWGHFDDFKSNMRARQPEEAVTRLAQPIEMICPPLRWAHPGQGGGHVQLHLLRHHPEDLSAVEGITNAEAQRRKRARGGTSVQRLCLFVLLSGERSVRFDGILTAGRVQLPRSEWKAHLSSPVIPNASPQGSRRDLPRLWKIPRHFVPRDDRPLGTSVSVAPLRLCVHFPGGG